jgi:acetyl-CoA carboxylase carboxyl transferase subunit alpha
MSVLKVPVISIVIGEGGSGGALGIGVANKVLMLENSYYSVISPEGCAAILFRDAAKAKEAAEALKITAKDLLKNKL